MGYKNIEQKRKYQREWVAARKAKWFSDKYCVRCNSSNSLELDHIDPTQKVSHSIWSWSMERITIETAKYQILCEGCHVIKTKENRDSGFLPGSNNWSAKLTEEDIPKIRALWTDGIKGTEIAKHFSVHRNTIYDVIYSNWNHV